MGALSHLKADSLVTVYVNGKQHGDARQGAFKGRPLDLTGVLKPGEQNQITILVDHVPLPELSSAALSIRST